MTTSTLFSNSISLWHFCCGPKKALLITSLQALIIFMKELHENKMNINILLFEKGGRPLGPIAESATEEWLKFGHVT